MKKCCYKDCNQEATHSIKPSWLGLNYCSLHFSIISRSLNKQNQLCGAHKKLRIEYAEILRLFVESCEGIVGTLDDLHVLYTLSCHRDKSLDNHELFAKVFSKLDVPYASHRKGHDYIYRCVSPCLFKNETTNKETGIANDFRQNLLNK